MKMRWNGSISLPTERQRRAEGREATTQNLTKINGKTYLFNDKGNPVYGLQKVRIEAAYTAYYFGDKKTSTMQKGRSRSARETAVKRRITSATAAVGYPELKDGYLYYMGRRRERRTVSDMSRLRFRLETATRPM